MTDRPILWLALAQTIVWAGLFYSFPAMLVQWEEALGFSKSWLTGAMTLALLCSAAFSPLAGRLIDRGKGALMMASATLTGGICLGLLSLISDPLIFQLLWCLIGICMAGALYEPCFALITRARGERAKRSIIVVTLVAGFASTIAFPVAHWLTSLYDWRVAIRALASGVILLAAPLMWFGAQRIEAAGRSPHGNPRNRRIDLQACLGSPAFWPLSLGFALIALLHGMTLHHLLPILEDRQIAPGFAVAAASCIGPMQIVGRLIILFLDRHASHHVIAITCFIAMGSSIVCLLLADSDLVPLTLFVILYGSGYGIVSIIRPVVARDILGDADFGMKSGALALFFLAGAALAPWAGSLLWTIDGYSNVLRASVVIASLGMILYLHAHRISRRQPRV